MQQTINLRKDKEFAYSFQNKNSLFRIEAVIHDGQWYDVSKWKQVAKVEENELQEYIKANKDILIENSGSYRVDYEEIVRWYKDKRLDVKKPLVPSNFIPKIWAGKTEVQHFLDAPKRVSNTLMITCEDSESFQEVMKLLKGYAKYKVIDSKWAMRVYTISTDYIEEHIRKSISPHNLAKLSFRSRANVLWRDLSDFNQEFLQLMLEFYTNYAKGLLKPHLKTLEIFIPSPYDREIQIQDWILRAVDKFDEKGNVPFSGYLASVIQRWVYDLPNNELGCELARFQRQRMKALESLLQDKEMDDTPSEEQIKDAMEIKYSKEDYDRLLEEHLLWYNLKSATSLNWDENNVEKVGVDFIYEETKPTKELPLELAYEFSLGLLKAFNETKDLDSLISGIQHYATTPNKLNLNPDFKRKLQECLKK